MRIFMAVGLGWFFMAKEWISERTENTKPDHRGLLWFLLRPSLGEEDLHGLWRSFDKEAPDVAIYGWSLPDRKLLSSQVQEECRAR